jgi:hypothetical protein
MRLRTLLSALVLVALLPAAAEAQRVRGVVVERGNGAPLPGVLVALLGVDGTVRAEVLSDAQGRFGVQTGAPGRYTLRAERVGYRPMTSPELVLAAGETMDYTLRATAERIALPAITTTAGRRCAPISRTGADVVALWSEARKALRSAAYTSSQLPYRYLVNSRVRRLDPGTLVTNSEEMATDETVRVSPFAAVPLEQLATRGFAEVHGDTLLYHAPDAEILLSDAFLNTHCFNARPADAEHAGMVGLAFMPVQVERSRADIQGVLWMDAASAELRVLEYGYVGGDPLLATNIASGRVEFRRLPSGGWIVSRWRIRMPSGAARYRPAAAAVPGIGPSAADDLREQSAEVMEIRTQDGALVAMAEMASVTGIVFDSTRSKPLAGARVSLAGTDRAAVSDSAGRYTLEGVPEGVYSLLFSHPRLDSIQYTPDPVRVVAIPPQRAPRDLAIPPFGTVLTASCPRTPAEGNGLLGGIVTSRTTGAPLAGIPVRAAWRAGEAGDTVRSVAVSDFAGMYRFCNLPARVGLRVAAVLPGADTTEVRLEAGRPSVLDLAVERAPASPGAGAVAGGGGAGTVVLRLVDAGNSRPIQGVTVRMGTGVPEAVSDRRGFVRLSQVPAGSYGLEFRHPMYGLGTARVAVSGSAPTEMEIRVPKRPVILEPLVVTARRVLPGEFNRDRLGRKLDIFNRFEIERMGAVQNLAQLATRFPGLVVKYDDRGNSCIESLRHKAGLLDVTECDPMQLVLDDMPVGVGTEFAMSIPLHDVESVIYLRPADAFARFGYIGQRGVLLVYTRGNGPTAPRGN